MHSSNTNLRSPITNRKLEPQSHCRRCDQSLLDGWHSGHDDSCPPRIGITLRRSPETRSGSFAAKYTSIAVRVALFLEKSS